MPRLELPLSRPCFGYQDKPIPTLWILGYSADLEMLRDCPFLREVVQGTAGPHIVQKSRAPTAMDVDKAGEHVVRSRVMTGMADKIFMC
jgi:hypothetical protein